MVYKSKDVANALKKKGFKQTENDHIYFTYYYEGQKTSIRTKISHNGQEIGDSLIDNMKKQVHLSKKDFSRLVECPMSAEEYKLKMLDDGVIKK